MATSGDRIDRFEIEEIIGRGAMGVVYRARDPLIGRVVALKTIDVPPGPASDAERDSLARFEREGRAAGRLSHPNIVTIYDVGRPSGSAAAWIAMEFVEGRTLRDVVPAGEKLPQESLLEVAMQVARALDYAHRNGVIHRDVKPSNIIIRNDGLVKLTDFGVAQAEVSDLTRTGHSVGSPSYISPEALQDEPQDGRSDLFSLGVVLYELLTGEKPFRGETLDALYRKILSESPDPPSRLDRRIGLEWDAIVMRLLAKHPGDRYPCAAALLEDLRAIELARPPAFALSEPEDSAGILGLRRPPELPSPIPDRVIEEGVGEAARGLTPHRKAMMALTTVAGFGLVVIAAAALMAQGRDPVPVPGPAPAASALEPEAPPPFELTIRVAHTLRSGRIVVTMDKETILSDELKGERSGMRTQGAFTRRVEVEPGRHIFRVSVADEKGRSWTRVSTRELEADGDATFFVALTGMLNRDLEVTWY